MHGWAIAMTTAAATLAAAAVATIRLPRSAGSDESAAVVYTSTDRAEALGDA